MKGITELRALTLSISELRYDDLIGLDGAKRKTVMLIRYCFGQESIYLKDFGEIFFPSEESLREIPFYYNREIELATKKWLNLVKIMIEDLKINEIEKEDVQKIANSKPKSNRIFIVHGKDEGMKQSVARTVEKLGLEPIILHEKPNEGRTVIEKFTDYSDVQFAIVLLSPDDFGCSREEGYKKGKFRARQNVILELGFFLGKLGRKNVVPIYRESENFEMPSDYNGVVYTPFDSNEQWKFKLVKELRTCHYEVDANKII